METSTLEKKEIYYRDFNLDKKHNVNEIPEKKAVYGIFGIVNGEPINCRHVGQADNLRSRVEEIFKNPPSAGLKKFMQGPWIQMLVYEEIDRELTPEETQNLVDDWSKKYTPKIDDEGEYPGYYDY
jgi:hypothetical protein